MGLHISVSLLKGDVVISHMAQVEGVAKLLSKYPLKVLQQDILQLREQKKARFQLSTYFRPGPNP